MSMTHHKFFRFVCFLTIAFPMLGATGCTPTTPATPAATGKPYEIVTTCGMVTDIVRQVAGPHATVTGLMGEGVDPHLYKPTRDDVARLSKADVIFYGGLTLEGKMVDVFERVARGGKPVVPVTAGLAPDKLRELPGLAGHFDPHVWMDVSLWSECVQHVAETLAKYDPPHASDYLKNAKDYRQELELLDKYILKVIASIPEKQRVLVTSHDAFEYFSRRYSIPVKSPQGVSTESEAGAKDINDLVEFLAERKLPAVFMETSTNAKAIQAIVEGAAQHGVKVKTGELFSDAMGAHGTYEGTYIGMLDANATTIAQALGGEAPAGGCNGKLKGGSHE